MKRVCQYEQGDDSKTAQTGNITLEFPLVGEMNFFGICVLTLWLYLPGFLANTFAMLWGKWLPKTGYGPWPIDGGRTLSDGNRILGDGKTWNGLIGGSLTSGLLCVLIVALMGDIPRRTLLSEKTASSHIHFKVLKLPGSRSEATF